MKRTTTILLALILGACGQQADEPTEQAAPVEAVMLVLSFHDLCAAKQIVLSCASSKRSKSCERPG